MTTSRSDVDDMPDPGTPALAGPLDQDAVLRWAERACALLGRARPVLDQANVFPVPDADTGTNLAATLGAARDAAVLAAVDPAPNADSVLHAFARGALVGARGSSGVILSEFLRGVAGDGPEASGGTADSTTGAPGAGAAAAWLAQALDRGARRAVAAVVDPRPGTMLTAARGAADAAIATAAAGGDLLQTVESARSGAADALQRSVDELDVLRRAGVLDAGAYGLVLVLDALGEALAPDASRPGAPAADGLIVLRESLSVDPPRSRAPGAPDLDGGSTPADTDGHGQGHHEPRARTHHEDGAVDGEFELMCVVRHTVRGPGAPGAAALEQVAPALRAGLQQVGDSVVVVGGADHAPDSAGPAGDHHGLWQVHVHTDHPLDARRVLDRWQVGQVVVRCLAHQVSLVSSRPAGASAATGVVACTSAPGLVMDLARSGAVVVLRGDGAVGRTDLLRAVHETDAEHVLVLPADDATLAVARGLADVVHPQVTVVGSTSDLHVVAALSAWAAGGSHGGAPGVTETGPDGRATERALLAEVTDAVAAVRAVQVDAARPAELREQLEMLLAPGGERGADRTADAGTLDPTVLTVLVGDLVPAHVVSDLVAHAEHLVPGVEVVVLPSGRRSSALAIGAEQQ